MISSEEAKQFGEVIKDGGVVLFPSDTVYGLACDPRSETAVDRLYRLKGRPTAKQAAVMFFSLRQALDSLQALTPNLAQALQKLLPGPVTLVLPNPERLFPLACGDTPDTIGIRVPQLTGPLTALSEMSLPVLQSSANLAGEEPVSAVSQLPQALLEGVDLTLDVGTLNTTASTVIDFTDYEQAGNLQILRTGVYNETQIRHQLKA